MKLDTQKLTSRVKTGFATFTLAVFASMLVSAITTHGYPCIPGALIFGLNFLVIRILASTLSMLLLSKNKNQ